MPHPSSEPQPAGHIDWRTQCLHPESRLHPAYGDINAKRASTGITIIRGPGDLPMALMRTKVGTSCLVSLYGGQVIAYRPARSADNVFYENPRARFADAAARADDLDLAQRVALRLGVPLCFPEFGPGTVVLPGDTPLRSEAQKYLHGSVRLERWNVDMPTDAPGNAQTQTELVLRLETRTEKESFDSVLRIELARELSIVWEIVNRGDVPLRGQPTMHTYFAAEDASQVQILGVENVPFMDRTQGAQLVDPTGAPLTFGECEKTVDQVYRSLPEKTLIQFPDRKLTMTAAGFANAVAWNPGAERIGGIADLPPDGYKKLVVWEPANVTPVEMAACGGRWRGNVRFRVDFD